MFIKIIVILLFQTVSLSCFSKKRNTNTLHGHKQQVSDYLNELKNINDCFATEITKYEQSCSQNDSVIVLFDSGNLLMCTHRPYTLGALSLTAPYDPLVFEAMQIETLCEFNNSKLYFNPSPKKDELDEQ
jgi:hypothetical protein